MIHETKKIDQEGAIRLYLLYLENPAKRRDLLQLSQRQCNGKEVWSRGSTGSS
jgi:hypothetical protein